MAGHSQFKNIMHRKGAQDSKRAKLFTKIIRELTVSAKFGGSDPQANPRLRAALLTARTANMSKETIDRAIKRGSGLEELNDYQEIRYEGYGPGGTAFIVETLTDNRNRTAPEIRFAFNKFGGSLGETNSVSYLFDRQGIIRYPLSFKEEDVFEAALESGAQDIQITSEDYEIFCNFEGYTGIRDFLIHRFGDPLEAQMAWLPKALILVDKATAENVTKLIDLLEDSDDVQHVWGNADLPLEEKT